MGWTSDGFTGKPLPFVFRRAPVSENPVSQGLPILGNISLIDRRAIRLEFMQKSVRFPFGILERRHRVCVYLLAPWSFLLLWQIATLGAQIESAQPLRGRVVFSDGTPAAQATVTATTICNDDPSYDVHISHSEVKTTAADGTFSFSVFDPPCNRYRFSASKPADYWLASDDSLFTGTPPVIPIIDLSSSAPSQSVQFVLNMRGGEVSLRVWDVATERFVHAEFSLNRKPIEGKQFGSIMTATGDDGLANTKLLPPGEYTVTVSAYPFRKGTYCPVLAPVTSFVVVAGTHLEETIKIDARTIKPLFRDCTP